MTELLLTLDIIILIGMATLAWTMMKTYKCRRENDRSFGDSLCTLAESGAEMLVRIEALEKDRSVGETGP